MKKSLLPLCMLAVILSVIPLSNGLAQEKNPPDIALGKSVTFSTPPNYYLTTDPDNDKQLTDGLYSSEGKLHQTEDTTYLWMQKGTVGWSGIKPVGITIDLGSVQPISGVSYSTAAGASDVAWPVAIYIAVSDDNKTWHYAGDLVALSKKNGLPPSKGYATFKYVTHDLQTKGRYISLGVVQPFIYTFVDEVEVYKGDDAWLSLPTPGRATSGIADLISENINTSFAQRRLNTDIAALRQEIAESSLSANSKSTFNTRLDKEATATQNLPALPADFKTILPLNDIHRDILAVHGEMLAVHGFKPLTVWHQHRYAWLPLLAKPNVDNKPQLNFSMLGNQFRSDDLLLTNASGNARKVTLQLRNRPGGAMPDWLKVYSVAWTDEMSYFVGMNNTMQGVPVTDALLPVDAQNGVYTIDVPAGMTRKVWFTIDSSKVPAGSYISTFAVNGMGEQTSVPLSLNISKVAMGTPRFSMGMWDYTDGEGSSGINPQNRQAAIALMRSHYVDTTWASPSALPRPAADAFDAEGNLKTKLNFSKFDQWIARWLGAHHYFVFAAVGDSFAGTQMDTPEFHARVGSWAKVLSSHMKELGLQPKQLGILLVDEPRSDTQDTIIAAWAKAINAAAPELTLFEDPNQERPDQNKIQDAITQVDILSPDFVNYQKGGEPVQKYFENLRAQGKKLWLYQCSGPVRGYNPQQYYRYQPWQAFAIGATGQGFWAFGDTGGAATSWQGYNGTGVNYAPAFLDTNTVYDSIHWDAAREGVEDYEELAMLQDIIRKSNNKTWKMHAQQVLNNAVKAVKSSWNGDYDWAKETDPNLADAQLQKVRAMLTQR